MNVVQTNRLADAIAEPIRIRFYIDGYHSHLLSKEMVALHRAFLKIILKEFPQHAKRFDTQPSPEKRASLVVKLLLYVQEIVISRAEDALSKKGVDLIARNTANSLRNSFSAISIFGEEKRIATKGKTYLDAECFGTVFCPRFDKPRLEAQVSEYINSLSIDSEYYEVILTQLKEAQKSLRDGNYGRTQRYYDALGDEIGEVSKRGFLKASQNVRRKVIEEKGVDGDMIGALASDAYQNRADVFVLLTNDSDHASLAERLTEEGKQVFVIGYETRPANALRKAVGDQNVLNLLTDEREFDFDPVWLRTEDAHSLSVLEDVRMQWQWWKSQGML